MTVFQYLSKNEKKYNYIQLYKIDIPRRLDMYQLPLICLSFVFLFNTSATHAQAIQTQIPTLQVCNSTDIFANEVVMKTGARGAFVVSANEVYCKDGYINGGPIVLDIDLTDSAVKTLQSTSIEQITGYGNDFDKGGSYTAILNGRCEAESINGDPILGCKFWMLLNQDKDNEFDAASFLVFDMTGTVISYGTGRRDGGGKLHVRTR